MNKLICHICGDIEIYPPICRKCGKNAIEQNDKIVAQKIFAELEKLKAYKFSIVKGFGIPEEDIQKLKQKFAKGDKK